ncbi:MAG: putative baseplate assembly protein [Salinivenus sp.]
MSLPEPTIDDRDYEEILDEALSRIPAHNPDWTNFNESDPGVTMLQVISFVAESMLYRANRVPERNRIKFLKLLGVERQPATVAEGLVQFSRPRGPLEAETVPGETEVRAGSVPFRTTNAVEVLPIEGRVYYKKKRSETDVEPGTEAHYRELFADDGPNFPKQPSFYETARLSAPSPGAPLPVVDLDTDTPGGEQSLWLALLARTGDAPEDARAVLGGTTLSLVVVPSLKDADRVLPPQGESDKSRQGRLRFSVPRPASDTARYRPIQARTEQNLLVEPGVAHLTLPSADHLGTWTNLEPTEAGTGAYPPSLADTNVQDRLITWIRIQPEAAAGASKSSLPSSFSHVGVNGASVEQRARVQNELLGKGTGDPDQEVQLANTPVLPDSLDMTIGGEPWRRIDDLVAAPPEVPRGNPRRAPGQGTDSGGDPRVYTLDRRSGTITFGDGLRGARPESGAVIQARYDYGGGPDGMVGIGAIKKGPNLPAGVKVQNPIRTWGGAPTEPVEEAEQRIAEYLKRRNRLVTTDDFEAIAHRTPGVRIGRVEVRPLFSPESGAADVRAEGVVTVLVIPASDPNRPDAPVPGQLFLDTVCDYLDRRRLVTTEVHVRGPRYRDVCVSIGVEVVPGADAPPVHDRVRTAIRTFLSPLDGGFEEEGWPLGRAVDTRELLTVAARVSGVASVEQIRLAGPAGGQGEEVSMTGVQLPRLAGLAVRSGTAEPLGNFCAQSRPEPTGDGASQEEEGEPDETFFPVPVVPEEC